MKMSIRKKETYEKFQSTLPCKINTSQDDFSHTLIVFLFDFTYKYTSDYDSAIYD